MDDNATQRIDPLDDERPEPDDPHKTRRLGPLEPDPAPPDDPYKTRKLADAQPAQPAAPPDPYKTRKLDSNQPESSSDSAAPESGWRASAADSDPHRTRRIPTPPPAPPPEPTVAMQRPQPAPPPQPPVAPPRRPAPQPQPYRPETARPQTSAHHAPQTPTRTRPPAARGAKPTRPFWTSFGRAFFIMGIVFVVGCVCAFAVGTAGYVYLASQLPSPEELEQRATELFTSSQIYDRDGNLLFELLDPQGGRRTVIDLDQMSPWLRQATIDTEDPRFYRHPGFDPIGIVRAVVQNLREGSTVSGASTIAQQLVRNLMLPPEERTEISASRKIKEIILAAEVTRRYDRDKILELYLNSSYFGNLAYGVQSAAEVYFQKNARDLNLAEGSFVAGLVQAPAVYDAFTPDGREAALARHQIVLRLMVQAGSITRAEADAAAAEMEAHTFTPSAISVNIPSPHFVQYVRQIVERQFGPEALYRGGLKVYTTLDPHLQGLAQNVVSEQVAAVADRNVHGGALVALEPGTGRVLAMVGSPDYNNEQHSGQINMAAAPRQTGSAIKPLTYLAAFEKGWTPATVIWDTPVRYPDFSGNVYEPRNYDGKFHGPQPVRSALANSYNIPAVKALEFVTVPEFLNVALRFGITTFNRPDYGLSITLGGGEAPLIEMAGAFQIFANAGIRMPPIVIERITNVRGDVQCKFTPRGQDAAGIPACEIYPETGAQIITPQFAYLISNMLSDNRARCPAFGCPNVLEIGRPAAVKTGTTNDIRDNWTIGYTPELLTGVWVGNPNRESMQNISGVTGAGPIWHNFMQQALANTPISDFARPPGIVEMEVCAVSGTQPSQYCPEKRREIFAADRPAPGPEHDWFQLVRIDAASGLLFVDGCAGSVIEKVMVIVPDEGRQWAQERGYEVAPKDNCTAASTTTVVTISDPADLKQVTGIVPIIGTVQMANFEHYELQFGIGAAPSEWRWISGPHLAQVIDGQLTTWDTNGLETGAYTLRLSAFAQGGGVVEARASVIVDHGATPTPTETPGPTLTPSITPSETPPLLPTLPPSTNTPEPTPFVPEASATPTPTEIIPPTLELPTLQPPTPTATPTIG